MTVVRSEHKGWYYIVSDTDIFDRNSSTAVFSLFVPTARNHLKEGPAGKLSRISHLHIWDWCLSKIFVLAGRTPGTSKIVKATKGLQQKATLPSTHVPLRECHTGYYFLCAFWRPGGLQRSGTSRLQLTHNLTPEAELLLNVYQHEVCWKADTEWFSLDTSRFQCCACPVTEFHIFTSQRPYEKETPVVQSGTKSLSIRELSQRNDSAYTAYKYHPAHPPERRLAPSSPQHCQPALYVTSVLFSHSKGLLKDHECDLQKRP